MQRHPTMEAISREIDRWPGASVSFSERGKHKAARITHGEEKYTYFFARTPSDRWATQNAVSDIRRRLRMWCGDER